MKLKNPIALRGRPRTFDCEKALDRALEVFWRKGYEGASLSDLTKAMKITRPSLYAAFGNKEELFQKVLDRYSDQMAPEISKALKERTARAVMEQLLKGAAERLGDPRHPSGCLVVQGALSCSKEADSIRRELISRREEGFAALRKRFEQAKRQGDLPLPFTPSGLARYVTTVLHGMSIQAASGARRIELLSIIKMAMQIWPR